MSVAALIAGTLLVVMTVGVLAKEFWFGAGDPWEW